MASQNLRVPNILSTLEVVREEVSHKASDLKSLLESVTRIEKTVTDLLAALSSQRVFWALDLLEKEGQTLADYLTSQGLPSLGELTKQLEESARKAWLDYPKMLEEQCRRESLVLDPRSRHPNYKFANGFLLVRVKKQGNTVIAVLESNERKIAEFPADVEIVVERVKKEEERLFGRSYDGFQLLRTIKRHYLELLEERGQPDGSPVPMKELASRITKAQRGYRPDEFIVDLSRLAREGPFEIDARRLELQGTRDDMKGVLLHGLRNLGYVGSLKFAEVRI